MTVATLALAAALAAPGPADTLRAGRWLAAASFGVETFTRDRDDWTQGQGSLGHRRGGWTGLAEVLRIRRFGETEVAGAVSSYFRLGRGTSGWARVQVAPDALVIAEVDAMGELEQSLGGGWTAAASYRRMSFAETAADIVGAAVNRYAGDWLLQGRGQVVMSGGRTGAGGRVNARRYHRGDPDRLVEAGFGLGQEVVVLGAGIPTALRSTRSASARIRWRLMGRWGVEVVGGWNREEGVPDRAGASVGMFISW